jgi:hypothetical protein
MADADNDEEKRARTVLTKVLGGTIVILQQKSPNAHGGGAWTNVGPSRWFDLEKMLDPLVRDPFTSRHSNPFRDAAGVRASLQENCLKVGSLGFVNELERRGMTVPVLGAFTTAFWSYERTGEHLKKSLSVVLVPPVPPPPPPPPPTSVIPEPPPPPPTSVIPEPPPALTVVPELSLVLPPPVINVSVDEHRLIVDAIAALSSNNIILFEGARGKRLKELLFGPPLENDAGERRFSSQNLLHRLQTDEHAWDAFVHYVAPLFSWFHRP